MKLPHKAHVAVVDGNRFMLLQNTGDPFEPTLKMVEEPDLSPSNFSAGVRHQDDAGQRTGATDLNEPANATDPPALPLAASTKHSARPLFRCLK